MHRAVMQACFPWFIWLCVASGLMILLVQFCGGRVDWRRLRRLPESEEGAVQSLSLVLTLPVFLMLVLFIVQVTQVMVGIMMVNYAAFAGARAASVWIPADVTTDATLFDDLTQIDNIRDQLKGGPERANVLGGVAVEDLTRAGVMQLTPGSALASVKYQKVLLAAVIPCLTISPSRDVGTGSQLSPWLQNTYTALKKLYPQVDPRSKSNQRIPQRLLNKLSYAAQFTTVTLEWQNVAHPNLDVVYGPTYNPLAHPHPEVPPWNPNEVGFRDPVTVQIRHRFALLPGIGRILATPAVDPNSTSGSGLAIDRTARQIMMQTPRGPRELYTVDLLATATFVNEGYKSLMRHAVQP
ncbi:MAG: hypothetical protein JWN70_5716 [Planctomycetaceae bacterium]|nr:hypothetical protein [Planctomycetaceae bacterium]